MRRFSVIFLVVLMANIFMPILSVSADVDKYSPIIGLKQVKDNNVDITYTGNHSKDTKGIEQYEYKATIYTADVYNNDGTPVDCSWHLTQDSQPIYGNKSEIIGYKPSTYSIINNVFNVTVTGTEVTTSYQGETLSWNPIIYVDSKEYTALTNATKSDKLSKNMLGNDYQGNILEWDYGICIRRITITESKLTEEYIFNQNPKGTVWIKDNAVESKGFIWDIAPYAYGNDSVPLEINQYKQIQASEFDKATYPVIVDPTVDYTNQYGSNNVCLYSSDATYATARSAASGSFFTSLVRLGQWLASGTYYIYRGFCNFDTSAIPDTANISFASLNYTVWGDNSDTDFNIVIQNGQPTYPHDTLAVGDYDYTHYSGNGGSISTASLGSSIILNATGITWINLTGNTKFALISSRDTSNTAPSGKERVDIYSTYYLSVTYTSTTAPTVTTQAATYVTKSSARINGYLTADGGEACNVSFKYALWNGSAWGTNTSTANQSGKLTGDSFYSDLTGLINNSTYRFMAVAANTFGSADGTWLNLTTLNAFSAPTNLSCEATSSSILLSWIKSDSSYVYIRYKAGSYPVNESDGNIIANQSTNSYIHTGLTSGTSYFYKMWGLEGGNLSTTNATCICTTTAGYASSTTNPQPTANISGWNSEPNGSVLENNPLYTTINLEADELGIPHNTWWLILGLGALVVGGLFVYTRTKDLLVAMLAVVILGTLMAQYGIFPIWTMYIFGVTGMGFSWKELR